MKSKIEYVVARDSREKAGHGWTFDKEGECLGTEIYGLKSADYSVKGFEDIFGIERKATTGELSINIFEKRFEEELKRLEEFAHSYMIFEFEYRDILLFPINSGIPKRFWHKLQMKADIMDKTIARYMVKYKTKIIFAGVNGKQIAQNLFHAFMKYGVKNG